MGREREKSNLYRRTDVEGYSSPAHIFGLDYYKPGSQGEDDFSRKEVWFYYCGDEALKEEFGGQIEQLLLELFVENTVDWDFMTIAPGEQKDSINPNLLGIIERAAEQLGMEYRQVLRRTESIREGGEMRSPREELEELKTVEVSGDVIEQNIILIDNVAISGLKLAHYTEILLKAGAKRVFCVTIGVTNHEMDVHQLAKGVTASAAVDSYGKGGDNE